jgi:hypothetical protein
VTDSTFWAAALVDRTALAATTRKRFLDIMAVCSLALRLSRRE